MSHTRVVVVTALLSLLSPLAAFGNKILCAPYVFFFVFFCSSLTIIVKLVEQPEQVQ